MLKLLVALVVASSPTFATFASDPASPVAAGVPTHAGTLEKSKPGDFLKFRQTQRANGQKQVLTLWQTYRGTTDGVATVQIAMTNRSRTELEPITTAAQDVQIGDLAVPLVATLLDAEMPPGVEVVSDTITKLGTDVLLVGPRSVTCLIFERVTKLIVPQGDLQVRNTVWWSGDVPVSGMVRNESETSGFQSGSSVSELVGFPGADDPEKISVESPVWFLEMARNAIADSGYDAHKKDRFYEKLGDGYLAHGRFDHAHETLSEIENSVYQDSLVMALKTFAGVEGGAHERDALGMTAEDVDTEFNALAYSYSNAFERMEPEEVRALAARATDPASKDSLWSAVFWRALLDGDRERAQAALREMSNDAGRDAAVGRAAYEATQLRRIDLLEAAAACHPAAAKSQGFLGSHYALLDELGREKESLEVARRYVAAIAALPQIERQQTTLSVLSLALYRPWSRVERFVVDQILAQDASGDPEAQYAALVAEGKGRGQSWSYASRAAVRGDKAASLRILGMDTDVDLDDGRPVIAALYASGKKDEAVAWVQTLAPTANIAIYEVEGLRTRIFLDFAAAEFFVGNAAEETRWIDEAVKSAIVSQQALGDFNREHKTHNYWEGGISLKSSAPFFLAGLRLVARGEHERALEFVKQCPSLRPGSGCVEDFWKQLCLDAGARGDHAFAAKVIAAMPATIDANSRNWIVRDTARAFAIGNHAAAAPKFVAALAEPALRDMATSSLVVQLCLDGRLADAEAVYAPWIATQDPKQWADAKVALAMARAAAGKFAEASSLFLAERTSSDFTGITGLDRENVLIAVGYHAARANADLTALGRFVAAVKDDYERAHVALGAALALGTHAVPDEFADPVEYSRF